MKKIILCAVSALLLGASTASAFDPRDLFGNKSSNSDESTGSTSGSGSGILGAIGDFVNNITANDRFSVDDIVGTWKYTSPSVSFKSENALQNIGGAAAATAVEDKLAPYYKRLGFTNTTLTVDEEHNFVMKLGLLQLQGTIEKDEENHLVFNFSAFRSLKLGSVQANATKSGNKLNLTFEATKLIQILNKLSGVLNSTALKTLTAMLNSYDDIYIGFKMELSQQAASK